jgi:hypothetical protein
MIAGGRMKGAITAVSVAALCGCAHAPTQPRPVPQRHVVRELATVEVFYRNEQPFGRRGGEEWSLGDLHKSDMYFSPDGQRFAFVRPPRSPGHASHMVVRNIAGDAVNEFPLYRDGKAQAIAWLDDRRLGYLTEAIPEQRLPAAYVVHDVQSGEVLQARSGAAFVWGPERRHVAFIAGAGDKQNLVVDGRTVWPRRGTTHLHQPPVWSPDGHGLALVDQGQGGARLVVLVEYDDASGDLTWNVPKDALSPGLRVFWAGDSKVVIGETALHPRFAAGWERLR